MVIWFTKHAREKMKVRQLDIVILEDVLNHPEHRFYDVLRNSEVVAGSISLKGEVVALVIVLTRSNGDYLIITVYPSKRFEEEFKRKVKSGRWVVIK